VSITRNQALAIGGVVLSAVVTSTAYFTDMFGPDVAKGIVGSAGFLNLVLSGVTVILTGQAQQVRDVSAMPGVDRIVVNSNATPGLASVAVDSSQPKVGGADVGTQITLKSIAGP